VPLFLPAFQLFDAMVVGKKLHLLNGNGVQLYQPVFLSQAFINKQGIEVFQGENGVTS